MSNGVHDFLLSGDAELVDELSSWVRIPSVAGLPDQRMGSAGGGPAHWLVRAAGAPILFFGTGLPEDRWHDSDERASIDVLRKGATTLAHLWPRLADLPLRSQGCP